MADEQLDPVTARMIQELLDRERLTSRGQLPPMTPVASHAAAPDPHEEEALAREAYVPEGGMPVFKSGVTANDWLADAAADRDAALTRGQAAGSKAQGIRAQTPIERINDKIYGAYDWLAKGAGQLTDAIGLTNIRGMSVPQDPNEPLMGVIMPEGHISGDALAAERATVGAEVKQLFPRLDAYSKPSGLVSANTIMKRVESAEGLSDQARTILTGIADTLGDRRIQPTELHALAVGEKYKPARIVRKPRELKEGEKQIVGAPLGIANARDARNLREGYLKGIEKGASGRDWYHDTGDAILFHANDDPARARLVAGDISITSPATEVSGNTGMGIKGYNQATAGVPVVTGRFPTAMGADIEALHARGGDFGALGDKRLPFAQNMAIGGGFHEVPPHQVPITTINGVDVLPREPTAMAATGPGNLPFRTRAVHDIWDGELHGYVNPDGTPMRTGFGPAQHRFMDAQQDKIVATANQRAIAGHTNWDDLRTQAAGWTGAKINAEDLPADVAARSPADYFGQHYAQGHREMTSGRTTGHMPELLLPENEKFRQLQHEIMLREGGIYDDQMRDQFAAGFGGLVGRSFEGPGLFEGTVSPGMHTQVLTGSQDVPSMARGPAWNARIGRGARTIDEGSRRIMNAAEAAYGLGMGPGRGGMVAEPSGWQRRRARALGSDVARREADESPDGRTAREDSRPGQHDGGPAA